MRRPVVSVVLINFNVMKKSKKKKNEVDFNFDYTKKVSSKRGTWIYYYVGPDIVAIKRLR